MATDSRECHPCFSLLRLFGLVTAFTVAVSGSGGAASIDQLVAGISRSIETITRAETNNGITPRLNQSKTIACLDAQFRVHADIPDDLKQGLFTQAATYPAMLRFANATNKDDSKKDIRGLSIKVSKVEGPVLWGKPGIQDFLLNSYPALFVATPEEFLLFLRARQQDTKLRFFINPFDSHLKSLWTVIQARKKHLSPLDIRYWSTVPFRHGEATEQVVKYSVTPCSDYHTSKAVNAGENQLRAAISAHLDQGEACFQFGVQKQTNSQSMPIEDASVIWDEKESPFQTLATITIRGQQFNTPDALASCERSSFNPWQGLAAHEPLGRMNEVRRQVYANAEKFRNKE